MNSDAEPNETFAQSEAADEGSHEARRKEALDWYHNVYQGDKVRQLSVRSIVSGMIIGALMSISNLYIGIKTGWNLGVTVTCCIIAYAVFKSLETVIPAWRREPFTILENYTMSSAATAASVMSASGLISAIPALYMTAHITMTTGQMMVWLTVVSLLGVFMAIPLKRQFINIDKLPFPSGIATAETLISMHGTGTEAMQKARSLFAAMGIGAIVAIGRVGVDELSEWYSRAGDAALALKIKAWAIPDSFPVFFGSWPRMWNDRLEIGIEGTMFLLGSGAIMGMRICCSLLVGGIFYFGFMGDWLLNEGIVTDPGYRGIVKWTLWPATAMLVTSGLLSFAMRWRTIARSLSSLTKIFRPELSAAEDPLSKIEVPTSWFVIGTLLSGGACVVFGYMYFGIHWWMGILAVLLAFVLSVVAARAAGETDITPIGAMGKISQLTYAAITPRGDPSQFTQTNLMTAMITAGAASHSADLLTDLKSGYLLGGNPRKQTISQLFGIIAGALVCVPVYMIIVPWDKIGSKALPMPSAQVWAGVARMLAPEGKGLPQYAVMAIGIGAALGILLTFAEAIVPKKYHAWVPSATGLGIAGVIPATSSVSMFLGALAAFMLATWRPKLNEKYTVTVSSGLIAGDSLASVIIKLTVAIPAIIHEMFK